MNSRRNFLRSCIIAAFLMTMLTVISQNVFAQDFKCRCKAIPIVTDKRVACEFKVCVKTGGTVYCEAAIPGQTTKLPCIDGATVFVYDCFGKEVAITADCKKPQIIAINAKCCVAACIYVNDEGCPTVQFTYVEAPCAKC